MNIEEFSQLIEDEYHCDYLPVTDANWQLTTAKGIMLQYDAIFDSDWKSISVQALISVELPNGSCGLGHVTVMASRDGDIGEFDINSEKERVVREHVFPSIGSL